MSIKKCRSLLSAMSLTNEYWKTVLTPAQFKILRLKGTEPPGTGEYENKTDDGTYNCAACNAPLFRSTTKFHSGCGWPAFFDSIPGAISRKIDMSGGMERIEIMCSKCDGHLGHVFKGEGFKTPTDERHCVNSLALHFEPKI